MILLVQHTTNNIFLLYDALNKKLVRDFILIHGVQKNKVMNEDSDFDMDEEDELADEWEEKEDEDESNYLKETIR